MRIRVMAHEVVVIRLVIILWELHFEILDSTHENEIIIELNKTKQNKKIKKISEFCCKSTN
jgi:hypothetical protein